MAEEEDEEDTTASSSKLIGNSSGPVARAQAKVGGTKKRKKTLRINYSATTGSDVHYSLIG